MGDGSEVYCGIPMVDVKQLGLKPVLVSNLYPFTSAEEIFTYLQCHIGTSTASVSMRPHDHPLMAPGFIVHVTPELKRDFLRSCMEFWPKGVVINSFAHFARFY